MTPQELAQTGTCEWGQGVEDGRAQEDQAGPRRARTHSEKAGAPSKAAALVPPDECLSGRAV